MQIAIVYNQRPKGLDRNDPNLEKFIEGDEWKTISAIGEAITNLKHQVEYFPIDNNIYERLKKTKNNIDLLFNLSEGINNSSDREAHIPMLAEILDIPYTGPNPLSAALILNKSRAKEIWNTNKVPTVTSQLFSSVNDTINSKLTYPLFVKPNGEGSGIGIKASSIVQNKKELTKAVKIIINEYNQKALVEEYLPGREFTIGIIGNGNDLITLPIVEINFDAFPKGVPRVDTFEAKFVYGVTGLAVETEFCPALVSKNLEKKLVKAAVSAYKAIGCRDFGRIDLRLDEKGQVYVLEINHPPGLMSDPSESSFFTISARVYGWSFKDLIGHIISAATIRLKS